MDLKLFGMTFRFEVVIICIALGYIMGAHLFCSCLKITPTEGFEMLNNLKNAIIDKGSSCGNEKYDHNGEVLSGYNLETPNKNGVSKHLMKNMEGTKMPLEEGKLNFFDKNCFSPDCCPSQYSNSNGCACLSFEQMNHIATRGMNSTEESEF